MVPYSQFKWYRAEQMINPYDAEDMDNLLKQFEDGSAGTPLRPNARRTRFTVEAGPPHGYEGGGSGRSHPENADPDQQVAKRMELSTPY